MHNQECEFILLGEGSTEIHFMALERCPSMITQSDTKIIFLLT